MKKTACIILCMTLMLTTIPIISNAALKEDAAYRFSEDFNSLSAGTIANDKITETLPGWEVYGASSVVPKIAIDNTKFGGSNAIKVTAGDANWNASDARKVFSVPLTGIVTVEGKMTGGYYSGLIAYNSGGTRVLGCYLNGGMILYKGGSGSDIQKIWTAPNDIGIVYNMKFTYYTASNSYDVQVIYTGAAPTELAAGFEYETNGGVTTVKSTTPVVISTSSNYNIAKVGVDAQKNASIWVDDLVVKQYAHAPYLYEPVVAENFNNYTTEDISTKIADVMGSSWSVFKGSNVDGTVSIDTSQASRFGTPKQLKINKTAGDSWNSLSAKKTFATPLTGDVVVEARIYAGKNQGLEIFNSNGNVITRFYNYNGALAVGKGGQTVTISTGTNEHYYVQSLYAILHTADGTIDFEFSYLNGAGLTTPPAVSSTEQQQIIPSNYCASKIENGSVVFYTTKSIPISSGFDIGSIGISAINGNGTLYVDYFRAGRKLSNLMATAKTLEATPTTISNNGALVGNLNGITLDFLSDMKKSDLDAAVKVVDAGKNTVSCTRALSFDKRTYTMTFNEATGNGKYTIDFSGLNDYYGDALTQDDITFNLIPPELIAQSLEMTDASGTVSEITEGVDTDITVKVNNGLSDPQNVSIIGVLYSQGGILKSVYSQTTQIPPLTANAEAKLPHFNIGTIESGDYVKLFVWDTLTALTPIKLSNDITMVNTVIPTIKN